MYYFLLLGFVAVCKADGGSCADDEAGECVANSYGIASGERMR